MKLQLLSDLHLETEAFTPTPAPQADLLVLAGDIDSSWQGYRRFAGWPVPVLVVPGNHEYDGRDVAAAEAGLQALCEDLGFVWLQRRSWVFEQADGRRTRFVGCTRWSDFDSFGPLQRERAMRSARYFLALMGASMGGQPLQAEGVRALGLADRAWLQSELEKSPAPGPNGRWQQTVAVTHFAPSLRSADPRYGQQVGTANFCNADDDLIARADLWLHGHLHCRHHYLQPRPGRAPTRVVCNARGLDKKGEPLSAGPGMAAHQPHCLLSL